MRRQGSRLRTSKVNGFFTTETQRKSRQRKGVVPSTGQKLLTAEDAESAEEITRENVGI
jgi:hypothetical protein